MTIHKENELQAPPINTGRVLYYDVLRVLAAVAVMVIHIVGYKFSAVAPTTRAWNVLNLADAAASWAVPVFFMLSGALLLSREYTLKKLYGKKILRIITCFVFWSAVYALWEFYKHRSLKGSVIEFIQGPDHMWFLFAIVGLYLFVPVLKKVVEDEATLRYFLILMFVISIVFNGAVVLLSPFSETKAKFLFGLIRQAGIQYVPANTFYFVFGYYLSSHSITKKQRRFIYIGGIVGFLFTAAGGAAASIYLKKPVAMFLANNALGICLQAIGIFVLAKQLFSAKRLPKKVQSALAYLADISFGAYLVHFLVILLLERFLNLHALRFHTLFSIPLLTIIVAVISFGISALLNRIPIVKKYLV